MLSMVSRKNLTGIAGLAVRLSLTSPHCLIGQIYDPSRVRTWSPDSISFSPASFSVTQKCLGFPYFYFLSSFYCTLLILFSVWPLGYLLRKANCCRKPLWGQLKGNKFLFLGRFGLDLLTGNTDHFVGRKRSRRPEWHGLVVHTKIRNWPPFLGLIKMSTSFWNFHWSLFSNLMGWGM